MTDCFCWMNLMPMIKIDNSRKSNKINIDRINHQKDRLKKYYEQFPLLEDKIRDYIKRYDSTFNRLAGSTLFKPTVANLDGVDLH